MSATCSDDSYILTKKETAWEASSRGICLVTKITATIINLGGDGWGDEVAATPYTSSGTSYSQYAVIAKGGQYQVTRVIS